MTETTAIAGTAGAAASSSSSKSTSPSVISSDFDTFLRMLTTQLENQDPLNPMDSSDFSMQLATFSGVEQQVKTNDLLTSLSSQFGMMGMAELAGWVGKEARIAGPGYYDGNPVTVYPTIAANADAATLVVKNAFGSEVGRQQIALPATSVTWAGLDANGTPLPAGTYSFSVESKAGQTLLDPTVPDVYTKIIEARLKDGATMLLLEGNRLVEGSTITALR